MTITTIDHQLQQQLHYQTLTNISLNMRQSLNNNRVWIIVIGISVRIIILNNLTLLITRVLSVHLVVIITTIAITTVTIVIYVITIATLVIVTADITTITILVTRQMTDLHTQRHQWIIVVIL